MMTKTQHRLMSALAACVSLFTFQITPAVASYYTNQTNTALYRNLGTPQGIFALADGSLWYADSQNNRLVKLDSSGNIVRTIGRTGTDEGEFENTVRDITQDPDGNLYVLDHCHITQLDQYGGFKKRWGSCGSTESELSSATSIHYSESLNGILLVSDTGHHRIAKYALDGTYLGDIGTFGVSGSGDGEFNEPTGVATGDSGEIYVVDGTNHRVQIFDETGAYISQFGSNGVGDFGFNFPKDILVLPDDSLVLTSQNTQKIKRYDSTGTTFLNEWGESGSGNSQFSTPAYLALADNGSIWVTDWGANRLQNFQADGTFVTIIQNSGTTDGRFTTPYALDFDASGNIYVFDSTGRVQKFNASGVYQSTIIAAGTVAEGSMFHMAVDPTTGYIYLSSDYQVHAFGTDGVELNTLGNHGVNGSNSGAGDFNHARGMAFDSDGYLYVTDLMNDRVQKFDVTDIAAPSFDGGYISQFSVDYPEYITIDATNRLFVSSPEPQFDDPNPQAIREFTTSGTYVGIYLDGFGETGTQYYKIAGFAFKNDNLYVADPHTDRNRIQVFDNTGTYVETIGSEGSGNEQFNGIRYARFNPVTDDLVVIDSLNHRLQILTDGVKIRNLTPSADVFETTNNTSLTKKAVNPAAPGTSELSSNLYFGSYRVSDFTVNLSQDRDWSAVNTIALPGESKALVVNLNPTDAPGISDTHSLYIVKQPGQTQVRVCPDATLIADVNASCANGYTVTTGDAALSSVTINSVDYWKVTGLTGTGAMGVTPSPSSTPTPSPTPTPTPTSSSATSSGTSSAVAGCTDSHVFSMPDLFQVNVTDSQATLYFTPLSDTNHYYVSFGEAQNGEAHGADITLAREGVQNYTLYHLKPGQRYYVKVRGQIGCQPGSWSNTMEITTNRTASQKTRIYYRHSPMTRIISGFKSLVQKTTPQAQVADIPSLTPPPTPAPRPTPASPQCRKFLWWCL